MARSSAPSIPRAWNRRALCCPESVIYCADALDAAAGADVLVLITEWNEFRALSPTRLRDTMRGKVMVDLRNVYDPVAMRQAGFDYHGIGRPAV